MDISVSISSQLGDEYRIIISPFDLEVIPCEVRDLLGDDIEIADVTLERIKGDNPTDIGILLKIQKYTNMDMVLLSRVVSLTDDILRMHKELNELKLILNERTKQAEIKSKRNVFMKIEKTGR